MKATHKQTDTVSRKNPIDEASAIRKMSFCQRCRQRGAVRIQILCRRHGQFRRHDLRLDPLAFPM